MTGEYAVADAILAEAKASLVTLDPHVWVMLYNRITGAIQDEREKCAKILDEDAGWEPLAREYALKIRARGER